MQEEKIMTLHPEGKQGVNISKAKYDEMRREILSVLSTTPELTFKELANLLKIGMPDFEGSIMWYLTTVKLDLEARGKIIRLKVKGAQRLKLADTPL